MREFTTVVSGVPRSGTSLMMQMLGAGGIPLLVDDVRAPDVDNPRGYAEYAPVMASQRDVSWYGDAAGRAVKVIHTLLRHLPEAGELRIILMERDFDEIARSQARMLARSQATGDIADEGRLAEVFAAQLQEVRRWAIARPRTALLAMGHRQVLEDPVGAARRVDAFLGGGLDVAAMAACADPALYRSR